MMNKLSRIFKDPVSGFTHLVSAGAALAGTVILTLRSPDIGFARPALLIYGISMVMLFAASSAYHLVKTSPGIETMLRKLDHTAIFLFIAGSYTPVCLIVLTGGWRWGLLVAVWCIAGLGIAFKFAYIKAPRWISTGIYLGMGWLALIGVAQLLRALPMTALGWLLVGGLFYSTGAIVYALKRPNFFPGVFGFHELWHLFVTAGSAAHYVFMFSYILPYATLGA